MPALHMQNICMYYTHVENNSKIMRTPEYELVAKHIVSIVKML